MIGFLKGKVLSKRENDFIIDISGVGYEIRVSRSVAETLKLGSVVSLWVYTHFRQDHLELFGFSHQEEKQLFLSLLKVNGVGPKMALTILGACPLDQFVKMIKEENLKALIALPRVGKKMAQQIVLTLKEQVSDTLIGTGASHKHAHQLIGALESLGFVSAEIRGALNKMKWEKDLQKDLEQALTHLRSP
ncbi:MAG: Holliday junction branch migration protein RuvA [Bdellovibrionales bacterium]